MNENQNCFFKKEYENVVSGNEHKKFSCKNCSTRYTTKSILESF